MAVSSYTTGARGSAVYAPGAEQGGCVGTVERLLQEWEQHRETCELGSHKRLHNVLRRRASLAARSLPIIPGRAVLEFGAGSGLWTSHLAAVLDNQNSITAAVFNDGLAQRCSRRTLPGTRCVLMRDLADQFPPGSFDYIVGTDVLSDELCSKVVAAAYRWLRPGGQIMFFGPNASNPLKGLTQSFRSSPRTDCRPCVQGLVSSTRWIEAASQSGFESIDVTRYEVLAPAKSAWGQAIGLIMEQAPVAREFSTAVAFMAVKPGGLPNTRLHANLAKHPSLWESVSVVVPCHNEESNVRRLVEALICMYSDYIHEIVVVDDNSTDRTAEVVAGFAASEPRVRLVKRTPPSGVGRALRDGYATARGRYILSMDCDFITIVPELRRMFDVVAAGHDGAIGSRFSSESALIRYPFSKILSNRGFHWIVNALLGKRFRDVSNNLKLYRAEILKELDIEENHFAANAETGLKPLLKGYDIRDVPMSWINRTSKMGKSSFDLLKVGPGYLRAMLRITWRAWRGRYRISRAN